MRNRVPGGHETTATPGKETPLHRTYLSILWDRRTRSRAFARAAVGCCLVTAASIACATLPPSAAATNDLYVSSARDVCHFPPPLNNGKVVAQDGGMSVRLGDDVYFLFGDTYVDSNGDGGLTVPGDGLITGGTIARTADLDAADCLTLTYKTGSHGFASPLLEVAPGEDCVWAGTPVVANGRLYFFYSSLPDGHCTLADIEADTGLARLVGDPREMRAERVGAGPRGELFWRWGEPQFSYAMSVSDEAGDWIYVLGMAPSGPPGIYVTRVREQAIESLDAYSYWDGSGWSTDFWQARPIFTTDERGITNMPSIAYSAALGRYLATYSCGFAGTLVCARTALSEGRTAEAITGPWSESTVIYDCPNDVAGPWLDCYLAFEHSEYARSDALYVTTSRGTGLRGWVMLRELELTEDPPAGQPKLVNAASDFSSAQLANGWGYLAAGGTGQQSALSWDGSLHAWSGEEQLDGPFGPEVAPLVDEDSGRPGRLADAVREWHAPSAGSVRISGEAWSRIGCGGSAGARIEKLSASRTQILWTASLAQGAGASYDFAATVGPGDTLAFRVAAQGAPDCDYVYFSPTMIFWPSGDSDGDGFSDAAEEVTGTERLDPCAGNPSEQAWPPDTDNDGSVRGGDIAAVVSRFGRSRGRPGWSSSRRYDLSAMGSVDAADILAVVRRFGSGCKG